MAGSCIFQDDGEEDLFFDSREDLSSEPDSCPGSSFDHGSHPAESSVGRASSADPPYQVWSENLGSVEERRHRFMRLMGLDPVHGPHQGSSNIDVEIKADGEIMADMDRIMSDGGAVLRSPGSENGSSMSGWSEEGPSSSDGWASVEEFEYRIKNLDNGTVFVVNEWGKDGTVTSLREVGSNRMVTLDEFQRSFGPSAFVQQLMRREGDESSSSKKTVRRGRTGWLKRLGIVARVADGRVGESNSFVSDNDQSRKSRVQRVKVRPYRKRSKELSAVYNGQDIKAHHGAILTMKFSPDGQYLASGGEDGVVRVWQVMECERTDENDIPEDDPSCIYFTVDHNSELTPLYADKEKKAKSRGMRRTSDSACVVVPPNVFRISEEPLHEFRGHKADVLDISWSKTKYLLSSSMDKTARLWQVGCPTCLKVFCHNNYVTSIQFNPVDENYFISGSIDGKVRIWEIPGCHVVDWTDIREIVTAVCYRPDGKGGVVGTLTGNCRFYDTSDNHLQLDAQVSLQAKKKSPFKRITGFQFCPTNPHKLMVSSADSKIRILDGINIVSKYKGLRNSGSQIPASFTADGRYIISASEDSNVYVWSHINPDMPLSNHVKSTWSCERFFSSNVSVAISWHGLQSKNTPSANSELLPSQQNVFKEQAVVLEKGSHGQADSFGSNTLYLSPSGSFTLGHEFFLDFLHNGSATWPEEKLPSSSLATSTLCKSEFKFLQTSCQNASHAWGQVIVTAGWDGRIRCYQNYGLSVHR